MGAMAIYGPLILAPSDQSGDHISIASPSLIEGLSIISRPCCRMCGFHKKPDSMSFATCAHLLKRPVGRPPNHVRRTCGDFQYQAASWDKPRRVIAKVEWHPGELFPRVGFVVTNMPMEADWIIQFYNQRGTAEQHIKEGKQAINWTRLSCKSMAQNEVRLQLHALAYNPGVFLQGTDLPGEIADWSLTSLQTRLIKTGARVVRHARAITFQLAEVAVSGNLFNRVLAAIQRLRAPPVPT